MKLRLPSSLILSFLVICFSPVAVKAQFGPGCDSLVVDSVRFNPLNNNQLLIHVNNLNTDELFSKPNFVVKNSLGDTVAMEFLRTHDSISGIQYHVLDIVKSISLPDWLQVHLYTDSFQLFHCADMIMLADTSKSCDSIYLDSMVYHPNIDELDLYYFNRNVPSVFFNYPSFLMFDSNGDTVGVSKTFLFAMGSGWGHAKFEILKPLNLPFSGYIEFFSDFQKKLECTFQFSLNANGQMSIDEYGVGFINIYPNPANDKLEIKTTGEEWRKMEIFDLNGQSIFKSKRFNSSITVNVQTWSKGVYILSLSKPGGQSIYRKFIVY